MKDNKNLCGNFAFAKHLVPAKTKVPVQGFSCI